MAAHSRVLGWRIPWTEEPGGCSPSDGKDSGAAEPMHTLLGCRVSATLSNLGVL